MHHLSPQDAFDQLVTGPDGLSEAEAQKRLARVGPNRLPEQPPVPAWRRFARQFHDVLIYVLLGAALITGLLGHWVDTLVILGVVLINAMIGFVQEGKAQDALAGLRNLLQTQTDALRDGQWQRISAEHLVPGDVVRLKSGDRVPADLRLFSVSQLRIEESALTGESVPVDKGVAAVPADAPLGDRIGMAYSGSLVVAGRGMGVVAASGPQTEIGRINQLMQQVQAVQTPLVRQMGQFGRWLSLVVVGLAGLMLAVGLGLHSWPLSEVLLAAIGFAVAAIPEGLPALLTIILALGVQRMARERAITRRLNAVETLGSVTVICSDKTGTLTRNEMTVREVVTRAGCYEVSGSGYAPHGDISLQGRPVSLAEHLQLHALIEVMSVANDTALVRDEQRGLWSITGEPTEGALQSLAGKAGFQANGHARMAVLPFESQTKYMAMLAERPGGSRHIFVKGAPDRLLDRCTLELGPLGQIEPLDRAFWDQQIEQLSGQGLRVLGAASREVMPHIDSLGHEDLHEELVFLGLVGIIDPPRPEAIDAIASCRTAGIRVVMITGDHAGTALAIARAMRLADDAALKVANGAEVEAATDEQLQKLVQTVSVFARTSPEHKLRIVQALQMNGEVVAMTGDGVNDAPALKRADVGVAMGLKGTEATKEAADIVLADDNFATIERAVLEGRTIYDNLRKAILFILPTNGAQGLVMLLAVLLGLTLPLTAVQILWVNMVVAVTLALALAFEPSEPDVMQRPPRSPKASLIDALFVLRVGVVSLLIGGVTLLFFEWRLIAGDSLESARTAAVTALVLAQAFYLLNARFLTQSSLGWHVFSGNRVLWLCLLVLMLLQAAFVYLPWLQIAFNTVPLSPVAWAVSLLAGLLVFLVLELEKACWRCFKR